MSPTLQTSVDAADVAVGQLADVAQAVLARQDLDERAEVLDRGDPAFVDLADLDPSVIASICRGPPRRRRRRRCEMETVPSSSMSILAPVSSWRRRIVLPPGPMSRPIFSGLILIVSSRGAYWLDLRARAGMIARSIVSRISSRASWAWSSVSRMISSVMPSILRSSWMPVTPLLGAGDLEVHVAEVVLVADDVGQQESYLSPRP